VPHFDTDRPATLAPGQATIPSSAPEVVHVESTSTSTRLSDEDAVADAIARAAADGFDQQIQENVSCCYAVRDKTWVYGPDNAWEFYTVLGDAPSMGCDTTAAHGCAAETVEVGATSTEGCC
jgi:hypothetical protein